MPPKFNLSKCTEYGIQEDDAWGLVGFLFLLSTCHYFITGESIMFAVPIGLLVFWAVTE